MANRNGCVRDADADLGTVVVEDLRVRDPRCRGLSLSTDDRDELLQACVNTTVAATLEVAALRSRLRSAREASVWALIAGLLLGAGLVGLWWWLTPVRTIVVWEGGVEG